MATTKLQGQLEIDHERGVIYFHANPSRHAKLVNKAMTVTLLRICNLPKPIPKDVQIDITHMHGVGWVQEKLPI